MANLTAFIIALTAIYMVPGPDMLLIIQTSVGSGRATTFAVVAGLATARAAHVLLAALGLALILRTVPGAFDAVRFLGSAYLIWLAVTILRSGTRSFVHGTGNLVGHLAPAYRRGVLTNLLNPKALLFCSVFLPQFVQPNTGDAFRQFATLGIILVVLGFGIDTVLALAGGALRNWLERNPAAEKWQRWICAGFLGSFGLRLLTMSRS